jgi:tetratricopeptide (TPR) repeat protein
MPSMNSGQRLSGRYTVRQRLSAGAQGETWLARDVTRERDVVIRVLSDAVAQDRAILESLNAELAAAHSLDSQAIAAAGKLERDGDQIYLVRDFVPGEDLTSLRAGSWRQIAAAVAQVADALATLHRAGFVHRDIKPGNVILRSDGTATLIDFGSAALAGAGATNGALSRYSASPQQLAGEPANAADDVYSLGALLYELLSGYPPFYPNFSLERARSEAVPALKPARPAPAALLGLAMSLLARNPADRPADLAQVAQKLRALLESAEPAATGSTADQQAAPSTSAPVVTIVRPILRQGGQRERPAAAERAPRRWLINAGFAILVILAISVFIFLPKMVGKSGTQLPAPAAKVSPAPAAAKPEQPAELDLRTLAEQMQQAEQVRDVFEGMYESLDKRAASVWAAAPFAAARKHGDEAAKQYAAREFKAALQSYSAGVDELKKAADLAQPTLRAQLEKGNAAVEAGQSAAAQAAFNLALKIDPDNAVATKGLKRAGTLDQVMALLASATSEERGGQLPLAVQHYEEALKLDPDTTAARDGSARVRARISGDQFAAAMSQGLAQLADGKLSLARASFDRARALRPGATEVNDALAQVSQAELRNGIALHREQAEKAERAERWSDAVSEYDAALKLDPALEFARTGRDRAVPRSALATQLDALVKQPDRLLSAKVREQAKGLVAEASKIDPQGPVLRQQIGSVSASLASFEAPVRVALESDNQTQVVIHRVGQLGVFDHREIDLTPGTYTVLGTRVGYRDVRREITILPGKAPPTLVVRCEDRI